MRDNLLEINERGLSDIPVILGGAALTRTYVERDLRSEYQGRLFYGKDAFEGLHTMDRLMELKRGGADDPDFGRALGRPGRSPAPGRPGGGSRQLDRGRRDRPGPARRGRPRSPPTTPCSFPLSSGPGSSGASPSTTSPPTSTRPPCSGPSGATGPTSPARRPTPSSRTASGPSCGPSWPRRAPPGCSSPRWPTAISRSTPRATTSSSGRTTPAPRSGCASPSPARTPTRGCRSPTSSGPAASGEADYAAFHVVTMGTRASGGDRPSFRRRTAIRTTSTCTASEWRWPRRWRSSGTAASGEEWGFASRGRADPRRPVPPAVPRRALLVGLRGLPRPGGQRQVRRAGRRRADRGGGQRGDVLAVPPRADHRGHHLPPPPGQVLRGAQAVAAGVRSAPSV